MGFIMRGPCQYGCGKQRGFEDTGSGPVLYEKCDCKGQEIADCESAISATVEKLVSLKNRLKHLKEMGNED